MRSGIYLIKYWFSVNDQEQRAAVSGAHRKSNQALEAEPDGRGIAEALGGLF